MYINLDPGSVGIDLPLDELIPLASRHGYAGINLPLEQAAALPDPDALTAVNDAVAGRSRDEQMDLERELPGASGLIDAATFVSALKTLGYDGPVTPEPFSEALNDVEARGVGPQVV